MRDHKLIELVSDTPEVLLNEANCFFSALTHGAATLKESRGLIQGGSEWSWTFFYSFSLLKDGSCQGVQALVMVGKFSLKDSRDTNTHGG